MQLNASTTVQAKQWRSSKESKVPASLLMLLKMGRFDMPDYVEADEDEEGHIGGFEELDETELQKEEDAGEEE